MRKRRFTPVNDSETVSIRIAKRNYELLAESARKNGHSLLWLINYIVDLHFQEEAKQ
jgi:hypothetical protein